MPTFFLLAAMAAGARTEEIREATLNLLEETREYDNFVLSSGCDIPPEVPAENIESFYDALNEYNKKN